MLYPITQHYLGIGVLPAGGLIIGGGISGTVMGMFPCSLALGVEVEGVVEDSVTPFLNNGVEWELLAWLGETSLFSTDGWIFGKEISSEIKEVWLVFVKISQ